MNLHVFDFDDTLFDSPLPPDDWQDRRGWWRDPLSLSEPYVPRNGTSKLALPASKIAAKNSRDKNIETVVVTGRQALPELEKVIRKILGKLKIDVDIYLKPAAQSTPRFKADAVAAIIAENPEVDHVEMWDDLADNLNAVAQRLRKLNVSFTPHLVGYRKESSGMLSDFKRLAGMIPMPGMSDLTEDVSMTIAGQMGGLGRLKAMLGARNFVKMPNGLQFQWPNKQRSRGNVVKITLNGKDLYDMEFLNASTKGAKSVKVYKDIYADQLGDIFEKQTGWYLSL